jgi:hypothetical protein
MEIDADAVQYTLRSVRNRLVGSKDFYLLSITGSCGGCMNLTQSGSSWILSSDKALSELSVRAVNAQDSETETEFVTAAKAICFYAKRPDEIGLRFDTNGDGIFETELADEDVNYDGTVSVADAIAAVRFATEEIGTAYSRDVDNDGLLTLLDAMQVLRAIRKQA